MSVPFSNTHLRVPRGFGTILEGLTREVLRDQPEDIPAYAALYFDALLKQREESCMDPSEWAAKLEDRFYNNRAFKNTGTSPERKTPEMTISKEKSYESQTEDESSHSAETSTLSTTQPHVSEQTTSTESTNEDEENDISEKRAVSTETGLSEKKAVANIQNNETSCTEEEKGPAISTLNHTDRPDKETDSNLIPDQNIARSDSQPAGLLSVGGTANVDVCAQELGMAEDEGDDQQESIPVDEEIIYSEKGKDTEVAQPEKIFPLSGLADVNVCITELRGTERAMERETFQEDSHVVEEDESLKTQMEDNVVQSLLLQPEITQGSQEEVKDQAQKNEKEIEIEASCGESNESLPHIEGGLVDNITPKEDSLVEISFEDIPEAQCITPVREKQPEGETLINVKQTNILEMKQMEESKELTASSTDQNVSLTEDPLEPEMETVKEEFNSKGDKIESQHAAFDVETETVDANNSNLSDSDDGVEEKGVKSISLSDQPTIEAEREIQEDEISYKSVDIDEIHEDKFDQNRDSEKETQSNDPGFRDETAGTGGGDEEEICTEGCSKMGEREINDDKMECDPSKQIQSNTSTAGMEGESETFEESAQQLPQENEESPKTFLESPEDTWEEKQVTPKQAEEHTYETTDCEIQEKSEAIGKEETISLTHNADWMAADHQEEERPAKSEDTTELPSRSDEEECTRPQEEEDIMDIPLDDPEANRAAAKIQAGFRGHMTRKKMKPEDKTEGEEVSSTGDVLNGSQGVSETGRSGAIERDDTSVPEQ